MNEKMRLSPLPIEAVEKNWISTLGPMLHPAVEKSPGWTNVSGLLDDVRNGDAKIVIIWDPEQGVVFATLYCEMQQHQLKRVFQISFCGGAEITEWIHMYDAVRAYAASLGCQQVSFYGRKGWERIFKGRETIRTFTDYVDDLSDITGVSDE